MFYGLKWGVVYSSSTNTFGGKAKIEFVYFTILCSNFVFSYKNAKLDVKKISHF